ncbi:hypothetical protein [Dictyobacter vulcani]|uniref:hypothetical protein n=1 Tax=Dictyobacter vulcani TaxID=2607529 RepID=UPI001250BDB7|nr:hypothetical protein [Dictyobacter vulcani]
MANTFRLGDNKVPAALVAAACRHTSMSLETMTHPLFVLLARTSTDRSDQRQYISVMDGMATMVA